MKQYFKKISTFIFLFLFSLNSLYADISVSTGNKAIDTPINKIFGLLQKIALIGLILGIMVCAIAWAIPYITKKERSAQNEDLMQLIIKIGVACMIICACVFFPIEIYNGIYNQTVVNNSGSDFLILL